MRFADFKDLTHFEQTLFALPFVLAGACLTLSQVSLSFRWVWIVPAVLLARISGMAFNQLIDRCIDARNPRTETRVIPSGRITVKQARLIAWGALLMFIIVCMQINILTTCLACVAASLLYVYSYMKRIHYLCHFVLGSIHCLGPVMAYAAIKGTFSFSAFFLGIAACLSVTGNDIVYAIQDYKFDCAQKLFSLPVRLGIDRSLKVAAALHVCCLAALSCVGFSAHLTLLYYLVVPVCAIIFFSFHRKVLRYKESIKDMEHSFFMCNVGISCSTFFLISIASWDVLL